MKLNFLNIKKLGLAIIAFEGTEHLYNIISSLKESLDYVSIGLLRVSYHGDKISEIDLQEIFRLRDEDHLVDEIVEIELDSSKSPREQETDKRNILIQDAEDHGCSHCIVIDSDEYYTKKSFDYALSEIDKNDYEITYCQYVNYVYDYKHYLKFPFQGGMYVPFVTKVKYRHSFECMDFDKPSDPTRRFVRPFDRIDKVQDEMGNLVDKKHYTIDYHIFEWKEVKMHHLSWIRADIRKKLENWSSKKVFNNYDDLIDQAVYNFEHFDEDSEVQKVKMLFNTPDNQVDAVKFPKQYIFPKVDIKNRLRPVQQYKKILVLSMSADTELFNALEDVSNETWRNIDKEKYKNIDVDFWTYTDAKTGLNTSVDKDRHIIYIKKDDVLTELINATYSKTIEALHLIKDMGLEYDYMIRTNNSTWINIPLVNEFLSYCSDDSKFYCSKLYAAFWSAFNVYMGGLMMIWSHRNVDIILRLAGSVDDAKNFERSVVSCDDNMIGGKLNERLIRIGLPYEYVYHSIGGKELYKNDFDKDMVNTFEYVQYLIKTFGASDSDRLKYDVAKMKKIDSLWKSQTFDISELYHIMMAHYDEEVIILPLSKNEWFSLKDNDSSKMRCNKKYIHNREDAWTILKQLQIQNGYKQGNY